MPPMLTERTTVIRTSGHLPNIDGNFCPEPFRDSPSTNSMAATCPKLPSSKFRHALKPQEVRTSPHAVDNSPPGRVSLKGFEELSKAPAVPAKPPAAAAPWLPSLSGGVALSLRRCLGRSLCICCTGREAPPLLPDDGGLTTQFYRGDWSPSYIQSMVWVLHCAGTGRLVYDL